MVVIAAMVSAFFVYGSPDWLFAFSGAAEFGFIFGFGMVFWQALLPIPISPRGPGSAGTGQGTAGLQWAGLQMSGLLVGLIAGLVLTSQVVEPLSRYVAR